MIDFDSGRQYFRNFFHNSRFSRANYCNFWFSAVLSDGVGAFLGQVLVVGVVLDIVGVSHDGEGSAVGMLPELAGDGLELGLGS